MPLVLSFKNVSGWESYKQYHLPTVEIKNYNVMIDGGNFFDRPIKKDLKTFDNIRKISTALGDDYTIGCLLDYPHFKDYYKLIATDISKQQTLDADPKAIKQINFTENLDRDEGTTIFFITEEAKDTVLHFSKGTVKVIWFYFNVILIQKWLNITR